MDAKPRNDVPLSRVYEFLRVQHSVRLWIEDVLEIQGKLDEDLHVSLRSGVFLCYLMLELEERSIPQIQETTQHQFKLKENILFFLEAVSDYGVPKYKLFHPADLWENKSIVNVVECVFGLSQVAAKKGFKIPLRTISDKDENWSDDALQKRVESMDLKDLKNQLSRVKTGPSESHKIRVAPAILRKKMELLAGKVDFSRVEKGFTRFQAVFRGHKARAMYQKRKRDQAYRDNVAKEILSTEHVYVKNLGACIKYYVKPLREAVQKKKPIIEADLIKGIFSDIEVIHDFNETLLQDLTPIVENWSPKACLGVIFLKIMDFLKIYRDYIKNFNHSLDTLDKCKKKSSFAKFLAETKENTKAETNNLDLASFLIMPIQRVPRYNLLLRDFVKHTWPDHPDFEPLKKATEKMESIAADLNEKKREAEDFSALIELQNCIVGGKRPRIAMPGRSLVRHGVLQNTKGKNLIVYLFNDMLLVGKSETGKKKLLKLHFGDTVKYKHSWDLLEIELQVSESSLEIQPIGKKTALTLKGSDVQAWSSEFHRLKESLKPATRPRAQLAESTEKVTESPDLLGAEEKLKKKRMTLRADVVRRVQSVDAPDRKEEKQENVKEKKLDLSKSMG